jgi:hypothetical protein
MSQYIAVIAVFLAAAVASSGAQTGEIPPVHQPLEAQSVKIEEIPGLYDVVRSAPDALLLRWRGLGGDNVEMRFELATGVEAVVEAEVVRADADALLFSYRLRSSEASRQRVQALVVETLGPVYDLSMPEGWIVLPISFHPAISWADVSPQEGLAAGRELGGFSFRTTTLDRAESYTPSQGDGKGYFHHRAVLPGIVRVWARGRTAPLTSSEELPPGMAANLPDMLENAVTGLTVGPVEIPADVTLPAWIGRLRAYARRSRDLGWIGAPELVETIGADLDVIENAAATAHTDRALARLRDLMARLDSARDEGSLLPEAYGLLTFNGEYLGNLLQRTAPALGVEESKGDGP